MERGKSLRTQQSSLQKLSPGGTSPSAVPCRRCRRLKLCSQSWGALSLLGDILGMTQSRWGLCSSVSSAVRPQRTALSLPAGDTPAWGVSITMVTPAPGETGVCPKQETKVGGEGPGVRIL